MKKVLVITFLLLAMLSFLLISCTQKQTIPLAKPVTEKPVINNGIVQLNWSDVENALFYDVVIELLIDENQNRTDLTRWQMESANSSCTWTIQQQGSYNWTVQAVNHKGRSPVVQGEPFSGGPEQENPTYDSPTVTIISPQEGETINSLCPVIRWAAEPGATVTDEQGSLRAYVLEECTVQIKEGGTIIHTGDGERLSDNQWQYPVPDNVLEYNREYVIEVIASQENSDSEGTDTIGFKTTGEVKLELSVKEAYQCETVIATVTVYKDGIDKVALFGKSEAEGETDYIKLLPAGSGWRQIDENNQAVFELNFNTFSQMGSWIINAQALGGAAQSSEESILIKKFSLTPQLSLEMCCQSIHDGDNVCVEEISEENPLEGQYQVNVRFPDDATAVLDEFRFIFEFAGYGVNTIVNTSSTYNYHTWLAQEAASSITVEMATECTKYATLTVEGTFCSGESAFSTYTTFDFTLDGARPSVQVAFEEVVEPIGQEPGPGFEPFSQEPQKTATVTFIATDTKSLCQATLTFFVYKVDAHGDQMDDWQEVEVPWGQPAFTIGSGERRIEAEATYLGHVGKGASSTIQATVVLHLGELDGATITASLEVIDCCDVSCKDQCGNVCVRESVSDEDDWFFDNVFYRVEMVNVNFIETEREFLITDSNNPASLIFVIGDAYLAGFDSVLGFFGDLPPFPPQAVIEGRGSRDHSPLFPDFISNVLDDGWYATKTIAECTGYPTKTTILGTITMFARDDVEDAATFTILATDENDNVGFATQTIRVDTLAPSLTVVQGLKKNQGPGKDALQFSFREEDIDQGVVCLGATVTIIAGGPIDSGERRPASGDEYPPEYYDNASGDVIVKIGGEDGKTWTIDPLFKNGAFDADGQVRLEVLSRDCYGNQDVSVMTGGVIEY